MASSDEEERRMRERKQATNFLSMKNMSIKFCSLDVKKQHSSDYLQGKINLNWVLAVLFAINYVSCEKVGGWQKSCSKMCLR